MAFSNIFSRETTAIVFNFQANAVQRMLDFDFLVKRTNPSVVGLVKVAGTGFHKCFFGKKEILLPVYQTLEEAIRSQPKATVLINFASARSAFQSSLAALSAPSIQCIVIIAEGVPEREERILIRTAKEKAKLIIGPATVGGIQAGAFKVGDAAGTIENIIRCKLYRPGSVGFVSKSGGMSNECYNIIAQHTDGIFEGIAIGGDTYPCSTFVDHLLRFEANPSIKMLVLLGELGDSEEDEHAVVEALKAGKIKKPLVAWVAGTCAALFKTEVQFGHAGAKSGSKGGSAAAKNEALRNAGAIVPTSFDGLAAAIRTVFGQVSPDATVIADNPPLSPTSADYSNPGTMQALRKQSRGVASIGGFPDIYPTEAEVAEAAFIMANRKGSSFISTISDDRGEEPKYCGIPISVLVDEDRGIGDVLALLWFKKQFPRFATKFLELCIVLTADHGPCVSGAHNTIVASRAGKDLVSCLCSGLLTIGPRFGGALDEAAVTWRYGVLNKIPPLQLVEEWKKKGQNLAGIGHRVKSVFNPDRRVEILKEYGFKHFPNTEYIKYAIQVESITTKKGSNLILNVDGCIAALFMDCLNSCSNVSTEELKEYIDTGVLNGLFVLARSIGLIGHTLDQKRLKQPLYRHPWDDVMFLHEEL